MNKKYILPMIVSAPTLFLCFITIYGRFTGTFPLSFLSDNWTAILIFLPVLGFATCIAMLFVKRNSPEWRTAAIVTLVPILLAFVLASLAG